MGAENFSEKDVWKEIQGKWNQLFGDFPKEGISVEWHDFSTPRLLEWKKSIHPESLEICINFEGSGVFLKGKTREKVPGPKSVTYYTQRTMKSWREPGERHSFLTIEMSREWLAKFLGKSREECPWDVRSFLDGTDRKSATPKFRPLTPWIRRAAEEMLHPPVSLHGIWFPAKIMEISAHLFASPELPYERRKLLSGERAEKVKEILGRDIENPPGLGEIAKEVGCSQFHLSRIFSEETGTTITRYLRTLRLEQAAGFLRSGKYNVTETAMAVGYSSLSHFSKAFAEHFGHCPCVFPLTKNS